jgi:hypothetical protein
LAAAEHCLDNLLDELDDPRDQFGDEVRNARFMTEVGIAVLEGGAPPTSAAAAKFTRRLLDMLPEAGNVGTLQRKLHTLDFILSHDAEEANGLEVARLG